MKYRLFIQRRAQREIDGLPSQVFDRLVAVVNALAENPTPHGCVRLRGREGWRIRVGDYRVLYNIDKEEHTVTVVHVGHRRDVYR